MTIKERNFVKDNFSTTIYDNANHSHMFKAPYLYHLYRCDMFTLKKTTFVATPSYLTAKMTNWIVKGSTTSQDGMLIKKPELQ